MYIDSPNFPRRKVLNSNNNQPYSPNKRWDQGIHGSDRDKLAQHVANTLKSQQKDSEILEKFRKEAENYKKQYMIQKYPSLQANIKYRQKTPPSLNHIIVPRQPRHKLQENSRRASQLVLNQYEKRPEVDLDKINYIRPTNAYQQDQTLNKFKDSYQKQKPYQKIIIKEVPAQLAFDMNMRMDYQRIIQKKNKEIQYKDQKLKKRKHQIQKLEKKLKEFEKSEELQKMVRQQDELKSIKNMLFDLRQQVVENGASFKQSLLKRANERRNLSQLQLTKKTEFEFLNPESNVSEQLMTKSKFIQVQKNPSIIYSPTNQQKKISFGNFKGKQDLQRDLNQLKKYNYRLQSLKNQ